MSNEVISGMLKNHFLTSYEVFLKKLQQVFGPYEPVDALCFLKKYFQYLIYYVQLSSNSTKFILIDFAHF